MEKVKEARYKMNRDLSEMREQAVPKSGGRTF